MSGRKHTKDARWFDDHEQREHLKPEQTDDEDINERLDDLNETHLDYYPFLGPIDSPKK